MIKYLFYPALALCLFASCKKSEEKKLIGKWKGIAEASDENHNGVLDTQEEQKGTSPGSDYWGYTFKKGGDAEVIEELSTPCKWELKNDGDILKITSSVHGGGSREFKVLTLTNTDMTLEYVENDNDPAQWQTKNWHVLKKQ